MFKIPSACKANKNIIYRRNIFSFSSYNKQNIYLQQQTKNLSILKDNKINNYEKSDGK